MSHNIQIRIGNLPSDEWKTDLQSQIAAGKLAPSVSLLNNETKELGSMAAIDPQIVAAAITGGSAIIVALIPVLVDVFRKKSKSPPTVINVTLHGTINSHSIKFTEQNITYKALDQVFASIGELTEVNVN